jgi:NIPSNAP
VIYRMRIYQAVPENLSIFHEFFRAHLLPVQLRHGARLVGRWETEDGRVVAVCLGVRRPGRLRGH